MIRLLFILCLFVFLPGCSVWCYSDAQGHRLTLIGIGKDTKFDRLHAKIGDTAISVNNVDTLPDANVVNAWAQTAAAITSALTRAFIP